MKSAGTKHLKHDLAGEVETVLHSATIIKAPASDLDIWLGSHTIDRSD